MAGLRRPPRRLPADRLRPDRAREGAAAPREERRHAARPRCRRPRRRPARARRDRPRLERRRSAVRGLGAGLGLRRRHGGRDRLPRAGPRDGGRVPIADPRHRVSRRRGAGDRRRDGPRTRGRADRAGGDRTVEPAALCRRRLRPAGRGRVPRGGDPEEPSGPSGALAGLHRRHHDDLLPLRGRGPDPDRRLLGKARRRSRRVPAVGLDRVAREPRRAHEPPRPRAGGGRHLAERHRRLRRVAGLPAADRRSARHARPLRGRGVLGHGLQDLAGRRPVPLGAPPRRSRTHGRSRVLRARTASPRAGRSARSGSTGTRSRPPTPDPTFDPNRDARNETSWRRA